MIVICDRDLLGTGLTVEAALALMAPQPGELIVHVHQELGLAHVPQELGPEAQISPRRVEHRPTEPYVAPGKTASPLRVIAPDVESDAPSIRIANNSPPSQRDSDYSFNTLRRRASDLGLMLIADAAYATLYGPRVGSPRHCTTAWEVSEMLDRVAPLPVPAVDMARPATRWRDGYCLADDEAWGRH